MLTLTVTVVEVHLLLLRILFGFAVATAPVKEHANTCKHVSIISLNTTDTVYEAHPSKQTHTHAHTTHTTLQHDENPGWHQSRWQALPTLTDRGHARCSVLYTHTRTHTHTLFLCPLWEESWGTGAQGRGSGGVISFGWFSVVPVVVLWSCWDRLVTAFNRIRALDERY